ncbi:hypothetical protein KORDIASMS9_00827 [Kordia sp. SMS9]|nr:hypothetical protein KORDIASMS9_00827 [Kordia sp. SMS9]
MFIKVFNTKTFAWNQKLCLDFDFLKFYIVLTSRGKNIKYLIKNITDFVKKKNQK